MAWHFPAFGRVAEGGGEAGRVVLLDIEFTLDGSFLLVLEISGATSFCPLVSDEKSTERTDGQGAPSCPPVSIPFLCGL